MKAGGVLVYSTCTLSRKENEKNAERFLKAHPEFEGMDLRALLPFDTENETAEKGWITLLPHQTGTDGFFICAMKRKE